MNTKTYMRLWASVPDGEHTCTVCGVKSPKTYSSFSFLENGEYVAYCLKCRNAEILRQRAARKAELAAQPRCEFCRRRGRYIVAGVVRLCGLHFRRAEEQYQAERASSGLGIFDVQPVTREDIFRWMGKAE